MTGLKLLFVLLVFIAGIILGSNFACNKTKCPEIKVVPVKPQKTPEREPTLVMEGGKIPTEVTKTRTLIDSFIVYEKLPVDTNAITQPYQDQYNELVEIYNKLLNDWNVTRDYQDTAEFKGATVRVNNSTKGNRIVKQRIFLDSLEKSIVPAKQRNQIYFGMGGLYNEYALSVGGGLMLKTKRDRIYEVNAYLGTDGKITYQAGTKLKIKLK